MFIERLIDIYGDNTPILADEIVKLFNKNTRAYTFRMIRNAEKSGQLVCYSRGVYYIPRRTFFGQSTICSEMVAEKKYLKNNGSVCGICAGLGLLNRFGITTQLPNTMEIVTNNETTRRRKVAIGGRDFVLRKARCEITNENYPVYTLLQLFHDMSADDRLDEFSKSQIDQYVRDYNITKENLLSMAMFFPSAAVKKMLGSGVLNGAL